jgi:4-hydroxybenzoate polyprenyltransferase
MIRALLVSLRPHQWLKNAFVLVAPFFGKKLSLSEPDALLRALAAAGLFSLVSSGGYLLNDLTDRHRDREHPGKRGRPIAAGEVAPGIALATAVVLIGGGLLLAFMLEPSFAGWLAGYVVIQVAYSLSLRQIVLLDVFAIASGFVIRVMSGAAVVEVVASSWLILTTIFLSLFLALCKRRAEVVMLAEDPAGHRATLTWYEPAFLDQLIGVTTASVVICYSLYTVADRTIHEFGTRNLVFTVPFVTYGIFRYLFLVHRRQAGASPVTVLTRDVPLLLNTILWAICTTLVIYRA